MMKTESRERMAAAVVAAMAGVGLAGDVLVFFTRRAQGSPDIAIVLLLIVIAALHLGLTGANAGLAAVLARRRPAGYARVLVWAWVALSGVATLLLSLFTFLFR